MNRLFGRCVEFALASIGAVLINGPVTALPLWHATGNAAAAAASAESPELGRPGPYRVGTQRLSLAMAERPSIGPNGAQSLPYSLPIRLFYPAANCRPGTPAVYHHSIRIRNAAEVMVSETGIAVAGSVRLPGRQFPLVIASHGMNGWDTHFSRILELLVSHGYVVASIDHGDQPFPTVAAQRISFANVLVDRQADQRAAIAGLTRLARARSGVMAAVDPSAPIGLIGYSMGGYGAVGTAGALYDPASTPLAGLPAAPREKLALGDPQTAARIGALVLMAPWGSQPGSRVWAPGSIGRIHSPTLLIDGDRDDVVDYRGGVRWLFDQLDHADRWLLTFHGAHHNVAGNAVDLPLDAPTDVNAFFAEPSWRQDRLNNLAAHFIVAFLDLTLKHDQSRSAFLNVPTVESDAGQWPAPFDEQISGRLSDAAQPLYWRGFPRGWASGMALEHKAASR